MLVLVSPLLSLLFELPVLQIVTNAVRLKRGGAKRSLEIIESYNGRGAGVGRALGVGLRLGVGLGVAVGPGSAKAYTLLSPAT